MTLSIVTINYNNYNGLRTTIESVLSQSWRDFEWIIIDGGSRDGSANLIVEIASLKHSNVSYWCSEKDTGIYNAMNKGISIAKGEYILFLNSGDSLYKKTTLEEVFCNKEILIGDILYGNAMLCYEDKKLLQKQPETVSLSFFYWNTINHQASFIKRCLFEDKKYEECYKICSDWCFWIECCFQNKIFQHIDLIVSNSDMSGISASNKELTEKERSIVIDKFLPKYIQHEFNYIKNNEFEKMMYPEIPLIRCLYLKRRLYHRLYSCLTYLILFIDKYL